MAVNKRLIAAVLLLIVFTFNANFAFSSEETVVKELTIKADKIVIVNSGAEPSAPAAKESEPAPAEKDVGGILSEFMKKHDLKLFLSEIKERLRQIEFLRELGSWKLFFLIGGIGLSFLAIKMLGMIFGHIFKKFLADRTKMELDRLLIHALSPPVGVFLFSIGVFFSSAPLFSSFSDTVRIWIGKFFLAVYAACMAWAFFRLVAVADFYVQKLVKNSKNTLDDQIAGLFRKTLKVLIIAVSVMLIGQNVLGLQLTALIAGAGVAGLAIAFAAQDTIGNLFGSIMIILDKPFKLGDTITVLDVTGSVESIGFRSTRIRNFDGQVVAIPNKELASTKILNITLRPFIKFIHNFTVTYDTAPDKMERAIQILHEIYDNHEGMAEDKAPKIFFNLFNDWSLNIMVIVWYHPGDYMLAQEWNHKMNLQVLRRFNDEGIDFAFPSNTTYLAYDQKRKLEIAIDRKGELN